MTGKKSSFASIKLVQKVVSLPQSEVTITPAPAALLFDYFTILCTEEAKTDVINDIAKNIILHYNGYLTTEIKLINITFISQF